MTQNTEISRGHPAVRHHDPSAVMPVLFATSVAADRHPCPAPDGIPVASHPVRLPARIAPAGTALLMSGGDKPKDRKKPDESGGKVHDGPPSKSEENPDEEEEADPVDEASMESFPASDPPASTGTTPKK